MKFEIVAGSGAEPEKRENNENRERQGKAEGPEPIGKAP